MGCIHFESADPRTLSAQPNDETSNTVFEEQEEQGGGIQEAWSEIKNSCGNDESSHKLMKKKSQVLLEGYVEGQDDQEDLTRAKSLTDDDLEELKGCLDLGFGFSYDEIPELCNTLPALELCYSMSQKLLDDDKKTHQENSPLPPPTTTTSPVANWKISSPGNEISRVI